MHPVFAECTEKSVLRVRILPWDELWHILGPVERVEMEAAALESYRAVLHPLRMRRRADEDDPRLLAARKLVALVAEQFAGRFGSEVAKFETLEACREALAEFHHALMVEMPAGGWEAVCRCVAGGCGAGVSGVCGGKVRGRGGRDRPPGGDL